MDQAAALKTDHRASAAQRPQYAGLRRVLYENGLSICLLVLFVLMSIGQTVAGFQSFNSDQREHGRTAISYSRYLVTGHCLEAFAENWESEFLQMGAFVFLTTFLFQKGSPESQDPYEPEKHRAVTNDSPWPVRKGGWIKSLYANSLSLAFLILFLISFVLHICAGAAAYNREQLEHGQPTVSMLRYFGESQFWFESLQNWQSEFLAIAAMVILSIFLRQHGSPESKPIEAPHSQNE